MSEIKNLEPRIVWELFDEITKTPRPSKKEEKIVAYLENFARKHKLQHKKDEIGNVVILRPAAESKKNSPTIILQSHVDMVAEKNSDVEFDFENDPIQTYITDDGWVKARGTTLGGDDGIGMAASLAALIVDEPLPAIEALFTVEEETGLAGAFNLGKDMLTGKYLINLDSEDDGEVFIGCAGGIDTVAQFDYTPLPSPAEYAFFTLDISGLKGGHSGDDIEKGHANSNKIATRILWQISDKMAMVLADFDGGNLRNAIPREAKVVFGVPTERKIEAEKIVKQLAEKIKREYSITDSKINIKVIDAGVPKLVVDRKTQTNLLNALQGLPDGVLAMSFAMPGLVETSTNLASVKFEKANKIVVTTSQRSSVDSARFDAAATIESVFRLGEAEVTHSEGYPGWEPNPSSKLLAVTKNCHKKLFGQEPKVRAIHAGLECGLFLQKYPHLEMVSFGPTIRGAHSPDERMEIKTVDRFWKLLLAVLSSI